MIKIVLQILLISLPVIGFGQSLKKNYTVLGTTQRLPLKNAEVLSYDQRGCGMPALALKPTDDSVFSVANCEVSAVFDLGNGQTIVARDINKEFFYTYTNLKEVNVSKGDTINKGDLLGLLSIGDYKFNEFIFMITNKKGMNLGDENAWSMLEQYNKNECDEDEFSYQ